MMNRIVFEIIAFLFASLTTANAQPREVRTPAADLKKNSLALSLGFHHSQSQDRRNKYGCRN